MIHEVQGPTQLIDPRDRRQPVKGSGLASTDLTVQLDGKFPLEVMKSIKKGGLELSEVDRNVLKLIIETDWSKEALKLSIPKHREIAAYAVAMGATICHGFGNFYAVTAHPCLESVRHVNLQKGRPADQVGSLTTTKEHILGLFDFESVPEEFDKGNLAKIIHAFYELGPFGFRGPAASHIRKHLVSEDDGKITTQIINPGYECVSNEIVAKVLGLTGEDYLFITSANSSHVSKGTKEEPAHYRMKGIQEEFGKKPGFFMVEHEDEEKARNKYPKFLPMSTSILSFHRQPEFDSEGRPCLVLERYGSLDIKDITEVVNRFGCGLKISEKAQKRLAQRSYND
jgi:hypothetical protein